MANYTTKRTAGTDTGFSASVIKFAEETKERMDFVFKASVSETCLDFIGERGPSGRNEGWPIDTGFSQYSWTISTVGFPPKEPHPRPDAQGKGMQIFFFNEDEMNANINKAELGDTIYGSFTAEYADDVSYTTGKGIMLVNRALLKWPSIVAKNVEIVRDVLRRFDG
jgi:hypothetical protein